MFQLIFCWNTQICKVSFLANCLHKNFFFHSLSFFFMVWNTFFICCIFFLSYLHIIYKSTSFTYYFPALVKVLFICFRFSWLFFLTSFLNSFLNVLNDKFEPFLLPSTAKKSSKKRSEIFNGFSKASLSLCTATHFVRSVVSPKKKKRRDHQPINITQTTKPFFGAFVYVPV